MKGPSRQSREFFEACYRESSDPWNFASSAYELARYQTTLDTLSRPSYRRGFEPGCSVGVLTAALAPRVQHLIACDLSEEAVARAKERCCACPHVEIYQGDIAAGPPEGTFDLIVFSELGYYFSVDRLRGIVSRLADRLEPGGEFVAVHWLGHSSDHVLQGDQVHAELAQILPPADWIGGSRHVGFRIDAWRRTP